MPAGLILGIASAAMSAAGAGAGVASSVNTQRAMNNTIADSLRKQDQLIPQATNAFQQSLQKSTPQAAQESMQTGADKALAQYQTLQNTPMSLSPSSVVTNPSQVIKDPRLGGSIALQNQAAAPLQGYSQFGLDQAINNLMAQGKLSMVGNQSANANSTLPIQLSSAQNQYNTLSGVGSLGQSIGNTLGMMNATGVLGSNDAGVTGGLGRRYSTSGYGVGIDPYGSGLGYS